MVALKNTAPNWSYAKYLKGMDRKFDQDRNIIQVAEDRRIHKTLWLRTLNVAFGLPYSALFLLIQFRTY